MKMAILYLFLLAIPLVFAVEFRTRINPHTQTLDYYTLDSITIDDFLDLNDTPVSYSGQATNCVTVNTTENGLIFSPCGNVSIESFGNKTYLRLDTSNDPLTGDLRINASLNITGDLNVDGNTLFVDSANNRVGIGTQTPVAPLEIQSLAASMRQTRYSDTDVQSAGLTVQRSGGTTVGVDVIVQNGWRIANFNLRGYDGGTYRTAASIQGFIDGTPGVGDMPGRLVFLTTADGASSATERLRIDSNGTSTFTGIINVTNNSFVGGTFTVRDNILMRQGKNLMFNDDGTANITSPANGVVEIAVEGTVITAFRVRLKGDNCLDFTGNTIPKTITYGCSTSTNHDFISDGNSKFIITNSDIKPFVPLIGHWNYTENLTTDNITVVDTLKFAGGNASISYDGTNLLINPKEVGSGTVRFDTDSKLEFRNDAASIHSPSFGRLDYTVSGIGATQEWVFGVLSHMSLKTGGMVFNDDRSSLSDTKIRGTKSATAFFHDSSTGKTGFNTKELIVEVNINGSVFTSGNITLNGSIGIGTSSPGHLLDISNTGGAAALRITGSDANVLHTITSEYDINYNRDSGTAVIDISARPKDGTSIAQYRFGIASESTGRNEIILFEANGSVVSSVIRTNGSNTYFNAGGGNVGIGTITPTSTLHVIGDANITSNLSLTGTLVMNNTCGISDTMLSFERAAPGSNQGMATGNGDALDGDPMACRGTVTSIAGYCETCSAGVNEIAMELRINGASQVCDVPQLTTADDVDSATCNVRFEKHDTVGCWSKTETGIVTGIRCTLALRFGS